MSYVKVADASGKTITYIEVDGKLFPNFNLDAAKGIPDFKVRKDDVFIIGYPKAGTHWVWEICRMLTAGKTDLEVIDKESQMLELTSHDLIDKTPSPRILNTHVYFHDLPREFPKYNNKIIYLRRNLKDTAVSFFHHTKKFRDNYQYDGKWEDYLRLVMEGRVDYGSWFDFVRHWEDVQLKHPELNILDVTYEDLKENPQSETKRIAEFLEVQYDDTLINEIADKCHFDKMLKRKGHIVSTAEGDSVIYRKGEVGDWKNWFTVAQDEWFEEIYDEKMKGSNLQFKYTINNQ